MKTELQSLQVVRGFAALAVVFYHTHLILMQYTGANILGFLALHGKAGVNIFFVLSGFIILKAHAKDVGNPSSAPRYGYRRFVRLYPIYWVVLTAYLLAAALGIGDPNFSWNPLNLISAASLLDIWPNTTLPLQVAWTLVFEVKFYLVFVLLLISKRLGVAIFSIWGGAVSLNYAAPFTDNTWLSLWILYFIAGMLVYLFSNRLSPRLWMPLAAMALALLAIYAVTPSLYVTYRDGDITPSLLWLLPTTSCGLLSVILLEKAHTFRKGFWSLLGDASYSIYLVHSGVISVCAIIVRKWNLETYGAGLPSFFATFVLSAAVGYLVHMFFERPLMNRLRKKSVTTATSDRHSVPQQL